MITSHVDLGMGRAAWSYLVDLDAQLKHGHRGLATPIPSDGGGFSAVQPLQHRLPACHGCMAHGGYSMMQYEGRKSYEHDSVVKTRRHRPLYDYSVPLKL